MKGSIVRKFDDKGFGFIRNDLGVEYFFHSSGCTTTYEELQVGDIVEFEVEKSNKGPRATEVERVN